MGREKPAWCQLILTNVQFVYFHLSKVKVNVNIRYEVFEAGVVHEHVQYSYFVTEYGEKFLPKRRCQPTKLKGVKSQKTFQLYFNLHKWFEFVCSVYYGTATFFCSYLTCWKQYRTNFLTEDNTHE
jgi:hypothetical protein